MLHWIGDDLYVGGLYVGGISRVVPEGWREWPHYQKPAEDDAPDHVKRNHSAALAYNERMDATPWRGWLMTDEDGDAVGFWATEAEARSATMTRARELTT